ncbi:hypothetical protein SLH49_19395 [Cognatiyoonia sp. IB215446]|uniref:hypothetical protein n=1 Tax=Cognatiyoonia sp. IB215446 TaxID=3097355 RepID=UPI002A12CBD3|nr:hypothetical protein [Cognatiyoonia sp. IB215446]MDX8350163.1 hypothetical protein [Cognatiyoonia sp. IB215446]
MSDQNPEPSISNGASQYFQSFIDNRAATIVLPLVPVFLGVMLKVALVDSVTLPPFEHMVENHIRGIWLEFISISYIGALAWGFGRSGANDADLGRKLVVLCVIPAIMFVLCLCFFLGFPKLGLGAPMFTIVIPGVLGLASLVSTSLAMREFSSGRI